jgi:hypothetical protein
MVALHYQELSWKMKAVVVLLFLTLKESTSSMKLCLLVVSSVEESLSSVWLCLKVLDGMRSIIAWLNLSGMVKDKDAISSIPNAAAVVLNLKNTVLEAAEDVLPMEEVVAHAEAILSWTAASSSILLKIMTVTMITVMIVPDFLTYKSMEEELVVNASLVL